MPKKLNLSGMRFGRLLAQTATEKDKHGAYLWLCLCDCGTSSKVRASQLTSGVSQSCGCGVVDAATLPRTHGQTGTPLYLRWRAMLDRTSNPNHESFHNYGGRGIAVCEEWKSFENFFVDMGASFRPDLELDREDTNGNYEPSNCRWITPKENQRNKRTNHLVTWSGETQTVQDWAERLGIKPNTIITRLRRGWSVDRALERDSLLEIANG